MSMTLSVPSIKCEGCGDTITKEIKVHDGEANVKVDVENKTIEVESDSLSESSVRQAVQAAGHEVG